MQNIRLKVAYDGTRYLGWQKTDAGPSIEEILGNILEAILQQPITLQAASRTDAGVHARGQVVNFFIPPTLSTVKLKHSLNCLLPEDISVIELEKAPDTFHPTIDCINKEYHYHVCHGKFQSPHERTYSWHYPYKLDLDAIRKAIPLLVGHRDFSAFCNAKAMNTYTHYERNLESIELHELPNERLRFEVRGNHFLYKMVRNLVGTLIFVGCGKIALDEIPTILMGGDRTKAGMTAPAHGLFLYRVNYTR